jgi:hypothetical protein
VTCERAAVAKEHAQDAAVAARLAALKGSDAGARKPAAPAPKAQGKPAAAASSKKQARAQQLSSVPIEAQLSPLAFGDHQGKRVLRGGGGESWRCLCKSVCLGRARDGDGVSE